VGGGSRSEKRKELNQQKRSRPRNGGHQTFLERGGGRRVGGCLHFLRGKRPVLKPQCLQGRVQWFPLKRGKRVCHKKCRKAYCHGGKRAPKSPPRRAKKGRLRQQQGYKGVCPFIVRAAGRVSGKGPEKKQRVSIQIGRGLEKKEYTEGVPAGASVTKFPDHEEGGIISGMGIGFHCSFGGGKEASRSMVASGKSSFEKPGKKNHFYVNQPKGTGSFREGHRRKGGFSLPGKRPSRRTGQGGCAIVRGLTGKGEGILRKKNRRGKTFARSWEEVRKGTEGGDPWDECKSVKSCGFPWRRLIWAQGSYLYRKV